MFHNHYNVAVASLPIKNNQGSLQAFLEDTTVIALKKGIFVALDADGFVVPATNTSKVVLGVMYADACGDIANVAAYASGKVAVAHGFGIATTDQVETGVLTGTPGAPLYVSANGKLTLAAGAAIVGNLIATSATSAEVPAGMVVVAYQPAVVVSE